MMRYLALGAMVLALLAAGCGKSSLQQQATNPQVKQAQTQGEAVVKGCLTKGGGSAIIKCVAPPGHSAQLKSCAISAVAHNLISQPKMVAALTKCAVKFR